MGSIENTVQYCCVYKGNRTLYVHSAGDHEVENLAALLVENAPAYHKWYSETIGKRTFGFLFEDGFVYFMIVDEGLGNPVVLKFLEHVRDEFKKAARKGSRGSFSGLSSITLQEQLVPVVQRLITSLERVAESGNDWTTQTSSSENVGLSPSPSDANRHAESLTSTKAPLLGKSKKQEKKTAKDHIIVMKDIELEEHRKSTERGVKVDSTSIDSNNQSGVGSPISLQKDLGATRIRSSSQIIRKKWWRQVWIVLAIDAAVCVVLFIIWMAICGGFGCIR